jgi:hypothetical protein
LHVGQNSPVLPSFTSWRASLDGPPRVSTHVWQARRVCICSSVASCGVPRMVTSPHSKWPQSGLCRSLGFAPVSVPSRCTGVHHKSDAWMVDCVRHGNTLRPRTYEETSVQPTAVPPLIWISADIQPTATPSTSPSVDAILVHTAPPRQPVPPHMACQIRHDGAARRLRGKIDKSRPATSSRSLNSALVRSRPRTTPMNRITLSDLEGRGRTLAEPPNSGRLAAYRRSPVEACISGPSAPAKLADSRCDLLGTAPPAERVERTRDAGKVPVWLSRRRWSRSARRCSITASTCSRAPD